MESVDKQNLDTFELIILVGALLLILNAKLKPTLDKIKADFLTVNWLEVSFIILLILGLFVLIFLIIKDYKRKKKEKEELEEKKLSKLNELETKLLDKINTKFKEKASWEIEENLEEIKKFINELPGKLRLKHKYKIEEFYRKSKEIISGKIQGELEREKEIRKQKRVEIKFKKQIEELFLFKKAKNSLEALPLDKNYSDDIVREAEGEMKSYLFNQKRIREIKQDALNYYRKNDLDTKPKLSNKQDEEIYENIREEIQKGKMKLKKEIIVKGEQLKKNFYRAKELNEEEKRNALAQGFKHIRGIELDGLLCGGGYYINKNMEKESDYHLYIKHLFKELNKNMKVEYCIDNKRIDVAYVRDNFKLGIEIETGSNKIEQLAAKIPWLNSNFNKWIFVCSRKDIQKYSKYVDNKKSYCLSPKKAKEKMLSLINSYDAAIENR